MSFRPSPENRSDCVRCGERARWRTLCARGSARINRACFTVTRERDCSSRCGSIVGVSSASLSAFIAMGGSDGFTAGPRASSREALLAEPGDETILRDESQHVVGSMCAAMHFRWDTECACVTAQTTGRCLAYRWGGYDRCLEGLAFDGGGARRFARISAGTGFISRTSAVQMDRLTLRRMPRYCAPDN